MSENVKSETPLFPEIPVDGTKKVKPSEIEEYLEDGRLTELPWVKDSNSGRIFIDNQGNYYRTTVNMVSDDFDKQPRDLIVEPLSKLEADKLIK